MEMQYCDDCGCELATREERVVVPSLSRDIESANKGESAVLCLICYMEV